MPTEPEPIDALCREEILTHLNNLAHRDRMLREEAKVSLLRQGKEATPAIIEAFEKEYRRYCTFDHPMHSTGSIFLSLAIFCYFFLGFNYHIFHSDMAATLAGAGGFIFGVSGVIMKKLGREMPRCLNAIYELLLRMDQPEVAPIIISMALRDGIWLSDDAVILLRKHLSSMTSDHWKAWTFPQREALYQMVKAHAGSSHEV